MSSSTLLDRPAATDPGSGLSALRQTLSLVKGMLACEPLEGDDPHSFNLINPSSEDVHCFSLEARSHQLFSGDHMQTIIADPTLLLKFTAFLSTKRPLSISILIYYLDAHKSLKAITYANAITYGLKPIREHHFTLLPPAPTSNAALEAKARNAFDALVNQELPAYITHLYIQLVSTRITKRITGTLAPHLRETSEGLAEVFCLTDPSRPDNPIVFSSEEFHRTTQYGISYVVGRNCRFLQGPKTSQFSVRRIKEAVDAGREHSEVILNYRRDGSPFMNLLMIAPLCDSQGQVRYFIGAQVDVTGLVEDCTEMESLRRLVTEQQIKHRGSPGGNNSTVQSQTKDELQALSEMLNTSELETVRRFGGRMHREHQQQGDRPIISTRQRLVLRDVHPDAPVELNGSGGQLSGVYHNYLLVRPFPSFRILFTSPSLRVPGILQSQFINRIGGSIRVKEDLTAALIEGRGVTAKIRWLHQNRSNEEGRNRWIHCTPLLSRSGLIGVWMVVLVDDEQSSARRWKEAPPVDLATNDPSSSSGREHIRNSDSYESAEASIRSSSPYAS